MHIMKKLCGKPWPGRWTGIVYSFGIQGAPVKFALHMNQANKRMHREPCRKLTHSLTEPVHFVAATSYKYSTNHLTAPSMPCTLGFFDSIT